MSVALMNRVNAFCESMMQVDADFEVWGSVNTLDVLVVL